MIASDGAVPSGGVCRAPASRAFDRPERAAPARIRRRGPIQTRQRRRPTKARGGARPNAQPAGRAGDGCVTTRARGARAWIEPQVRVGRRRAWRARARTHGRIREGCRANTCGRGRARTGADAGGERLAGTGRGGRGGTGGRWGGEKGKWQSACGGARGESCARRRGARRGQPQPCGAWSHGPTRWCVRATRCGPGRGAARGCGVGGRSGLGWWRVGPPARSRRNRAVVCQPCHAIAADRCCGDASRNACVATPVPIAPRRRVAGPRRRQERML